MNLPKLLKKNNVQPNPKPPKAEDMYDYYSVQ